MLLMMLFSSFAVEGVTSSVKFANFTEADTSGEMCPPCEVFFRKLEKSGSAGKLVQTIRVQERGEPKSGTGVLYTWGAEALLRTCDYLQEIYGEKPQGYRRGYLLLTLNHTRPSQTHLDWTDQNSVFLPSFTIYCRRCSCCSCCCCCCCSVFEDIFRVAYLAVYVGGHGYIDMQH